jgi:hypothetical protein
LKVYVKSLATRPRFFGGPVNNAVYLARVIEPCDAVGATPDDAATQLVDPPCTTPYAAQATMCSDPRHQVAPPAADHHRDRCSRDAASAYWAAPSEGPPRAVLYGGPLLFIDNDQD